ncbi:MAG: hypothetical protein HOI95_10445 [Chromatiales bacterium]|jgi:lysozyme family protein|nr:hypothetical protein [Chromatiales bacterium]
MPADYASARRKLEEARELVALDSPEFNDIGAAIAALGAAQIEEAKSRFIDATKGIEEAIAKVQAAIDAINANPISGVVDDLISVIDDVRPVAEQAAAILSGEAATAPEDTPDTHEDVQVPPLANPATVPEAPAAQPEVIQPVREQARPVVTSGANASETPDKMIDDILRREGGFVDHPNDKGGPTNFGVTLATLRRWRNDPNLTADDVRAMSIDEARQIYKSNYFLRPKIDQHPVELQPVMFDMSINHGPGAAIKMLQRELVANGQQCSVDGGNGSETITCTNNVIEAIGAKALVNKLVARRIAFYKAIVGRNASQKVFLRGWLKRAEEFRIP